MGINERRNYESYCITIGRMAPDFTTLSTDGYITLSQYRGKWVILMSEPGNFAAVPASSLAEFAKHNDEFVKRNVQILVVTLNSNFSNIELMMSLYEHGIVVPFPVLEDKEAQIADKYGMVNPDRVYEESVRDLFIINPEGRIKAIITYPVSCGRNTYEVLRVIDSLQLTEKYNVYTPANWVPGNPVIEPTTHSFREAIARKENSNLSFDCLTWYYCLKDYYSLFQENNDVSEQKKRL
jgi:peroxiredoxin (alkyl hydroperoxide reductase subunit C)